MEILFLGTGTSTGVPQIGCRCKTCRSNNIKDKRLRSSVLISINSTKILIDCGPDFRQQMLTHSVNHISGILITHEHYDHVGGLDDIRPYGSMNIYAEKRVNNTLKQSMPYCFKENKYPGVPVIQLNEILEKPFEINKIEITPLRVMHANLPILGFKIGKVAYLTDVKTISNKVIEKLKEIEILIINALRIDEHISHLNLSEALEISNRITPQKTILTHLSHDIGLHEEIEKKLSKNIIIAHDGMKIVL